MSDLHNEDAGPLQDSEPVGESITINDASGNAENAGEPAPSEEPPVHDQDQTKISVEDATHDQAQEMARSGSTSSISSVKEGHAQDAAPYGTRSRNRTSASRPNYADDADVDSDAMSDRMDSRISVRSVSTDPPAQQRDFSESRRSLEADDQAESEQLNGTSLAASGDFSKSASPSAAGSAAPERKKRKYERVQGPKNGLGGESIPGTSQFLARPSGTPEARPAKRRKAANSNADLSQRGHRKSSPVRSQLPKPNDRRNCLVTFEKSKNFLQDGKLIADDGDVYAVDDHVYTVCEPPGDPYYLSRIMQFRRQDEKDPDSPIKFLLVNWYYRPKDIGKYSIDPRLLFASMHSDEIPITSLRGKCEIKHRTEVQDLERYKRERDAFYFTQLYDRYIHRPYEMIPSSSVINVPDAVKKALNERWRFIVVEQSQQAILTSNAKTCKKCSKYCAPSDSVDCGICRNTYHMTCLEPPLPKKPSRGFAWSCVPCSRAHEKKLEQRHTAIIPEASQEDGRETKDGAENDEDDQGQMIPLASPDKAEALANMPWTQAEIAQANLWPWRYLGIHCAVEDVLQYDDRAIYPRASSRIGVRFQAVTAEWPGRPFVLVKPLEIKKKVIKTGTGKKDQKLSKDTVAQIEKAKANRAKRPRWVQDEPKGYVPRGEDFDESDPRCTATKITGYPFEAAQSSSFAAANAAADSGEQAHEKYIERVRALAARYGLADPSQPQNISTNYLDKALYLYLKHSSDAEAALNELATKHSPSDLGNPELTKEELKKFEDGVRKHGSDLRSVKKYVKSKSQADIVRFYYTWKWTARGKEIWGSFEGRRGAKRRAEASWTQVADDEDDSCFDKDKSQKFKQRYQCKFCSTNSSRQWRRAPQVAPGQYVWADPKGGSKEKLAVALCERCASMWRKYAITWEDPEEIAKTMSQPGGRAWKRKGEEDLLRELIYANEVTGIPTPPTAASLAPSLGIHLTVKQLEDPAKKKGLKLSGSEKETTPSSSAGDPKKKGTPAVAVSQPQPPPIVPAQPKMRVFPCAVCSEMDVQNDQLISCKECKLTVHRRCYAVSAQSKSDKWMCDTCLNDRNQQYSLRYKCMLCPVTDRQPELVDFPRLTHKKKSDRDKEKERLERDLALKLEDEYKKQQAERRRPQYPREALKPTSSYNWVHITCAVWTPEIKFGDAEKMEGAEGMGEVFATPGRIEPLCKVCKTIDGACIACHQCGVTFHVSCAQNAGFTFGFDVSPVKGSRKDSISSATLGTEKGALTAAVWCKEHAIKGVYHPMTEFNSAEGLNALQLFVHNFKQADLALTGTARKANHLIKSTKAVSQAASQTAGNRRVSLLVNGHAGLSKRSSQGEQDGGLELQQEADSTDTSIRKCNTCSTEIALRWHHVGEKRPQTNGMLNGDVSPIRATGAWQCHKCFTEQKHGVESKPQDEEEARGSIPSQPDYFQLVPPMPPQLPPPPPSQASSHAIPPVPSHAPQAPPQAKPQAAPLPQPQPGPPLQMPLPPQPSGTGYGVKTTLRHTDSPFVGVNGSVEDLEKCQRVLWASTVTLRNNTDPAHCCYHTFYGQEFGDLDRAPGSLYQTFIDTAGRECRYDPTTSIIQTPENNVISNAGSLMSALVHLCRTGPVNTYWDVYRTRDAPPLTPSLTSQASTGLPPLVPGRRPSFAGPQPPSTSPSHPYPGPMYGPSASGSYQPPPPPQPPPPASAHRLPSMHGHPPAPPPGLPSHRQPPGMIPPPHNQPPPHIQSPSQHLPPLPAETYSPNTMSRASPYYAEPRNNHAPHHIPPHHLERQHSVPSLYPPNGAGRPSPTGAPAHRPSTPRDPPPSAGASSSPNLKNLVH